MNIPRDLSGASVAKAARRLGFEAVRQKGSHVQMVKDGRRVTVPAHPVIAPGTLQNILRQAGVTLAQFLDEL